MTVRFLHDHTLQEIDAFCKWAESQNQKVRVTFEMYEKEIVGHVQPDLSTVWKEEDNMTFMFSHQIKSSKDLFQFDNEDIKILTEKTKEELR
jgi:hypothetical protein